jgi:hypothetical protein
VGSGTVLASPDAMGDGLADPAQQVVTVPARVEHDGTVYAVTQIAPFAFQNAQMTSVELPEGLERVGQGAFQFCRALTAVELPASVRLIGSYAFFGCNALASVGFADDAALTEIGDGAFAIQKTSGSFENADTAASLTSITLPRSLNLLGSYAFYGQTSLASVTFAGATLNAVSPYAFGRCTALERIDLPTLTSKLERVGRFAFEDDVNLRVVTFQGGVSGTQVTQAGNEFSGCTGIEQVIYYDEAWNALNYGSNALPANGGSSIFNGNFSFGTGGFTDAANVTEYYTVWQYASEKDALAHENPTGYLVVAAGTSFGDVLAGTCEALEEEGFEPGAWVAVSGLTAGDALDDSQFCYPGDALDLGSAGIAVNAELDDYDLPSFTVGELARGVDAEVWAADGTLLEQGVDYTFAVVDYYTGEDVDFAGGVGYAGAFTLYARAVEGGAYTGEAYAYLDVYDDEDVWERLGESGWSSVMQRGCQAAFANASAAEVPCEWAVVVAGGADHLTEQAAAAALAGALDAPLLLTEAGAESLDSAVSYEVNRVAAATVVVVGDTEAVSQQAEDELADLYVVEKVYRIAGADAADTAARCVSLAGSLGVWWDATAVVVPEGDGAAAAVAAAWACGQGAPLVWAGEDGLGDAALAALAGAGVERAVLVGAVSEAAASQLEEAGMEVLRVAQDADSSADPSAFSAAFAAFALDEAGAEPTAAVVASAADPELAMAAATLCGAAGAPLLFDGEAARTFAAEHAQGIARGWVLGQDDLVDDATLAALNAAALQ